MSEQPRQTLPEDLEAIPPGPELAALLNTLNRRALSGGDRLRLAAARNRLVSYVQAQLVEDLYAVTWDEPPEEPGDELPESWQSRSPEVSRYPWCEVELAFAMRWTRTAAGCRLEQARELVEDLPAVHAALLAGEIDMPKALVIRELVGWLPSDDGDGLALRRLVVDKVIDKASGWTTGQLRARLRKLILALNPDGAKKRYAESVTTRRVECFDNPDGTGELWGRYLPPQDVAAVWERLTAIARAAKAAGDPRRLDQLRADAFLDLLNGEGVAVGQPLTHHTGGATDTTPDDPPASDASRSSQDVTQASKDVTQASNDSPASQDVPQTPQDPPPAATPHARPDVERRNLDGSGQTEAGATGLGATVAAADLSPAATTPQASAGAVAGNLNGSGQAEARSLDGAGQTDPDVTAAAADLSPAATTPQDSPGAEARSLDGSSQAEAGATGLDAAMAAENPPSAAPPHERPDVKRRSLNGSGLAEQGPAQLDATTAVAAADPEPAGGNADPAAAGGDPVPAGGDAQPVPADWDPAWPIEPWTPIGPHDVTPCPVGPPGDRYGHDTGDYDGRDLWPSDWPGRWITDPAVAAAAGTGSSGPTPAGPSSTPAEPSDTQAAAACEHCGQPSTTSTPGTPGTPGNLGTSGMSGVVLPAPRRGVIELQVPLLTALGIEDLPGELNGYGPVMAEIARHIITALPDAQWRYSVYSHLPELALHGILTTRPTPTIDTDEDASRRRPTTQQAALVRTRDRTCRAPGCRRPARICDLDHTQPWIQGGPTLTCNLGCLCRAHHLFRHTTGCELTQLTPGVFVWRTPRGLQYLTKQDPPLLKLP